MNPNTRRGRSEDFKARRTGGYQTQRDESQEALPSFTLTSPSNPTSPYQPNRSQQQQRQQKTTSISSNIGYLQEDSDSSIDGDHLFQIDSIEDSINRLLALENEDIYGNRSSNSHEASNNNYNTNNARRTPSPTESQQPNYPTTTYRTQRNPLPSPPISSVPPSYRSPTPTSSNRSPTPTSYFPLETIRKYSDTGSGSDTSKSNSTTNLNQYHQSRPLPLPPSSPSSISSPLSSLASPPSPTTALYPDWRTFSPPSPGLTTPVDEKYEQYGGLPSYTSTGDYIRSKQVPMYKKRWFWIVLVVISAIAGGGGAAAGILLGKKKSDNVTTPTTSGSLSGDTLTAAVPAQTPISGSTVPVVAGPITAPSTTSAARRLVVFGASYCDNGHPRAADYQVTLRPAPYYQGRASNGIVWNEYLANDLLGSSTDLRNYAYSGAMVDNSITYANIPDTKAQIASYLADIKSGLIPALPSGGKTVIVIWVGLNPVMSSYTFINPSNPPTQKQIESATSILSSTATALLAQISFLQKSLLTLLPASQSQAFDILLLPLPPTEILPWAQFTAASNNPGGLKLLKSITETYNTVLANGLAGLNTGTYTKGQGSVVNFDVVTLYNNWIATPSTAGVNNVLAVCVEGTTACSTPLTHFWWDSIHMTTAVHQKFAQALAPSILSLWKK